MLRVLLGLVCLVTFAMPVVAQTEIKFPIKVNATTLRGELTQSFADELSKATDGRYKVTIYPGGQLYDGDKATKATLLGNVQMSNEPNSAFTSYTKSADLMELPFGFDDEKAFQAYLHGPRSDLIRADLEKAGFHVMAMFDEGPFVIGTRAALIQKPADFKGQVIRTSGHPVVVDGLRGMGASTVKIALAEVYSALQQGTISGVYTTFDAFVNEKLVEVAPKVMLFPSYGAYFWVANKTWWQQQSEADRKLMTAISDRLAKKYDKDIWDGTADYIAAVQKSGGTYYDPTKHPAELKAFQEAMKPVYAAMRGKFGAQAVAAVTGE